MLMKVSDYIADFFASKEIDQVFTVVGGGSMHLNDSFGHHPKLRCLYNHHEQASAIAAEAYARISNKPAIVCVTSGPGTTNTLTGVVGAWMDSIPMIVISGQTKTTLTMRNNGLDIRSLGNQEVNIVPIVKTVTKNAVMIMDSEKIRYELEKALYIATSGRPGPVWIDIPLDIQGSKVNPDELEGYIPNEYSGTPDKEIIDNLVKKICAAKRPIIYAGNGIRIADAHKEFIELQRTLNIPVVTAWNSIDLIATEDSGYVGRAGTMGDRSGNFAVQNSDLLIILACRLNIYQSGYDPNTWARGAFTVMVDIDPSELKKPTIRIDLPVCCDVKAFMKEINASFVKSGVRPDYTNWRNQCQAWKKRYLVVRDGQRQQEQVNVYNFIDVLSRSLVDDAVTVVANGSASVVGSATYYIKEKSRFIMNDDLSSMGYDLPAAIGACIANGRKDVICIAGDGSIQMNLQELQTILTNHLPLKIFVINNDGYHQVRLTQKNMFKANFVGMGPDSGDLNFPSFEKLAYAYGYPYYCCSKTCELADTVDKALNEDGAVICEVFVDKVQIFEPKLSARVLPSGKIVSPALEDMSPFLPHDELVSNMYVNLVDEPKDE